MCKKHSMVAYYQSKGIEYPCWRAMIDRCENIKHKSYKDYGGRGIKVCAKWRYSFPDFVRDMGPRPDKKHSIGRINNNDSYNPSNCRWETLAEQAKNKRMMSNNTTGVTGISPQCGKYIIRLTVNGKRKHFGYFNTLQEAIDEKKRVLP